MNSYSKIIFFSLLIIVSSLFISCDNDNGVNQVLPYVPRTNVSINLDDPKFYDLQSPNQAVVAKQYNGATIGYKGHGIIVIKAFDNDYRAWDATSTYDYNEILDVDGAVGTCPESGIKYNLINGVPLENSKSKTTQKEKIYPLQPYRCRKISANKLVITDR